MTTTAKIDALTDIEQHGEVINGQVLLTVSDRISIELTGSLVNRVSDEEVQRCADAIKSGLEAVSLLVKLQPYLDAIICYASNMGEHEPNRIVHDINELLAKQVSA